MSSNSLNDLVNALRRAAEEAELQEVEKESLTEIFARAVRLSLRDVSKGCDPEEFAQLTVVNFTALASREGYETAVIRGFIRSLNS